MQNQDFSTVKLQNLKMNNKLGEQKIKMNKLNQE